MTKMRFLSAFSIVAFLIICLAWAYFGSIFPETGWDFPQFYIAGSIPVGSLYDQKVFRETGEEALGPQGVEYFPPYVRPAVFSLPLHLLALLPYRAAFLLFAALQFACFCLCLFLLFRRFGLPVDLLPVFALFYPALMGIVTGQDAHGLGLLVLAGFLLLEKNHDAAAGAVWSLCLYKFNLILWIPLLLLARGRWRAVGGFAATGALLAVSSALLAAPSDYLQLLRNIEQYTVSFTPEAMIGLRALSLRLGWEQLYFVMAIGLLMAGVPLLRKRPLPDAFMLALLGSLLCSYHVNWYDGALAVIPIAAAFDRGTGVAKLIGIALLAAFPLWVFRPIIAALLLLLWLTVAWSGRHSNELDLPQALKPERDDRKPGA